MNRRGFFGALGAMVSTAALDPEKLLWVPGKKVISIPVYPPLPVYLTDPDSWFISKAAMEAEMARLREMAESVTGIPLNSACPSLIIFPPHNRL